MKQPKIFLFAGEASGDLHGEKLVSALYGQFQNGRIYGVGGPKMRSRGLDCIVPMEKFEVMGFVDVFFALPRLIKLFRSLRDELLKRPPDVVLLIDYPGFNLALAKSLRKRGFKGKICHYICPSVWAWGKKRIPKMEKILDQLFVIFPFEKQLFDPSKLNVQYVGHPLLLELEKVRCDPVKIDEEKRVVALFPGSREKELRRNFPMHLRIACQLLEKDPNLFFGVSVAKPSFSRILDDLMKEENFPHRDKILLLSAEQNHALMQRSAIAIAKSGTNNLELALQGVPTVVTYGVGPLDLFIAKYILRIRLPFYCIVNIVANKEVFPELIGPNLTEKALFEATSTLLFSEKARALCRKKCLEMGIILEKKSPEKEIVNTIKEIHECTDSLHRSAQR